MKTKTLKVVSYNLHGLQRNDEWRFGKIAYELSKHNVDICGFQEVINGYGIEDTSYQIAFHLNNITGLSYTTHWLYCHNFNEIYPEGLSILSYHPMSSPVKIDLNQALSCKLEPLLTRFALAAEFNLFRKKMLFTTLHLDHHKDRKLRASQAEKLIEEIEKVYNTNNYLCSIITGDFNDLDTSPCLKYFKEQGYRDSYREANKRGGNTFHSSKPTVRIDHILIKGDVEIEKSELLLYDSELSDHVGVMTTIRLPEKTKVKADKPLSEEKLSLEKKTEVEPEPAEEKKQVEEGAVEET